MRDRWRILTAACALTAVVLAPWGFPDALATGASEVPPRVALSNTITSDADGIAAYVWGPWEAGEAEAREAQNELIRLVDSAAQTIDIAAYACDLPPMTEALGRALDERDVTLRLAVNPGCETWSSLFPDAVSNELSGLHHKFLVVDDQVVWTGSANFTTSSFTSNSENVVVITSTQVAAAFTRAMDHMLSDREPPPPPEEPIAVGDARVDVVFTKLGEPEDLISRTLLEASESVHVAMLTLTNDRLARDLITLQDRATLEVGLLLDDGGACNNGSDLDLLLAAGIEVFEDDFNGQLHHKYAVIDADGYAPVVLTGSANWSGNGMHGNHENVLRIWDRGVAAEYEASWQKLRSLSTPAAPCKAAPPQTSDTPTRTSTPTSTSTPTPTPTYTPTPSDTPTPDPTPTPRTMGEPTPVYLPLLFSSGT